MASPSSASVSRSSSREWPEIVASTSNASSSLASSSNGVASSSSLPESPLSDGGRCKRRGKMVFLALTMYGVFQTVEPHYFKGLSMDRLVSLERNMSVDRHVVSVASSIFNYNMTDDICIPKQEDDDKTPQTNNPPGFVAAKYNYSAPLQPTRYHLLETPTRHHQQAESIVAIVLSARGNFERRDAIRSSWAQNRSVYFVIGGPEPDNCDDKNFSNPTSVSSLLAKEQAQYDDIIDSIHPDTYKGLPYKLHYGMQWVIQNLPSHVQWIVKADDDAIVRMHSLQYHVLRNLNSQQPLIIGKVAPKNAPHTKGKWAEDPVYKHDKYPPFAYGSSGYIVSRPVAQYLADTPNLYYWQGEDAGLGIWLAQSDIPGVTWLHTPEVNNWKECHRKHYMIGHNLETSMIKDCFLKLKDMVDVNDKLPGNPQVGFFAAKKEYHLGTKIVMG